VDDGDDEHDAHAILVKPDLELFLWRDRRCRLWNRPLDALAKDFQQPDLLARSMER